MAVVMVEKADLDIVLGFLDEITPEIVVAPEVQAAAKRLEKSQFELRGHD